ncbi:MAG TPA: hypothetical protein VH023_14250 [Rhodopila sp.]|nr:hypothetical protein [Rhodopila sp.]
MPHNVGGLLHVARVLLGYGRHLLDTLRQRAAAPGFNSIAACFGTASLATILSHLDRGIQRAAALERFLLARAATGRDLYSVEPRGRAPQPQPAPAAAEPEQPAAEPATRRRPRPASPTGWTNAGFFMPTPEDLDRQVRRTPIGQTIAAICRDLGVVPGFCTTHFWSDLLMVMQHYGDGLASVMQQERDHRKAFDKEEDRKPARNWDWLRMSRDALHQVLGFFIGEPPVNPLDPAAAIATAPP